MWQCNDSAWEAAVIQFYNEANYNVHRLHLLGWDLHTYDADAGAPEKASPLLNFYSSCTMRFFFICLTHAYSCVLLRHSTVTIAGAQDKDSTGATMMRIPVSTGGMSLPNNTAYDIIFSIPATALLEVVRTCGNATTQHGKLR